MNPTFSRAGSYPSIQAIALSAVICIPRLRPTWLIWHCCVLKTPCSHSLVIRLTNVFLQFVPGGEGRASGGTGERCPVDRVMQVHATMT
jgi:hypothetical protein